MASRNFVRDANVLLENPKCLTALRNGAENRIPIPYAVLSELDALKRGARPMVAMAVGASWRTRWGGFSRPTAGPFSPPLSPDDRILREIERQKLGEPILATNDRILQLKARVFGIPCEGYRDAMPFRSESQIYAGFAEDGENPPPNSFRWESGTPAFSGAEGPRPIAYAHEIRGLKPRTVSQNLALELMLAPNIDIVSLQSEAGSGRTSLALAAALYLPLERKGNPYERIDLVKPLVEIGAKWASSPATSREKRAPTSAPSPACSQNSTSCAPPTAFSKNRRRSRSNRIPNASPFSPAPFSAA